MLLSDIRRGFRISRWLPLLLACVCTLLLSVQNGADILIKGFCGEDYYLYGALNYLLGALRIDKYKLVLISLLCGLYTGSYCKDENTHILRHILTRIRLGKYVRNRFLSNTIIIILTSEIVFCCYALVYRICGYPLVEPSGIDSYEFYYEIIVRHPLAYLAMTGAVIGMQAAACGGVGLLFSAYKPNLFVSIGLGGVVFFLALSCIPSGVFSVMGITGMDCVLPGRYDTPQLLMFFWSMLYPGSITFICGLLFYRRLRWRRENGEI